MNSINNFIHDLYPLTKLTFSVCMIIAVFFLPDYRYGYGCFLSMLVLALLAGVFKNYINFLLKSIFTVIIIVFIMHSLLHPGKEIIWQNEIFAVKKAGVLFAAEISSKLLVITGAVILFFQTTREKDFVLSLKQAGLSHTTAYIIMLTLIMLPQMKKKLKVILDAQRSRGMEIEGNLLTRIKAYFPALGPIIFASIAETERKVLTLEARAFSAPVKKTSLLELEEKSVDKFLRYFFIGTLIFIIIGRFFIWKK